MDGCIVVYRVVKVVGVPDFEVDEFVLMVGFPVYVGFLDVVNVGFWSGVAAVAVSGEGFGLVLFVAFSAFDVLTLCRRRLEYCFDLLWVVCLWRLVFLVVEF